MNRFKDGLQAEKRAKRAALAGFPNLDVSPHAIAQYSGRVVFNGIPLRPVEPQDLRKAVAEVRDWRYSHERGVLYGYKDSLLFILTADACLLITVISDITNPALIAA